MPKIELTTDEVTQLAAALETEVKSAKRAQNTSKTPQIKEVWQTHESVLVNLRAKILAAK